MLRYGGEGGQRDAVSVPIRRGPNQICLSCTACARLHAGLCVEFRAALRHIRHAEIYCNFFSYAACRSAVAENSGSIRTYCVATATPSLEPPFICCAYRLSLCDQIATCREFPAINDFERDQKSGFGLQLESLYCWRCLADGLFNFQTKVGAANAHRHAGVKNLTRNYKLYAGGCRNIII